MPNIKILNKCDHSVILEAILASNKNENRARGSLQRDRGGPNGGRCLDGFFGRFPRPADIIDRASVEAKTSMLPSRSNQQRIMPLQSHVSEASPHISSSSSPADTVCLPGKREWRW